MQTGVWPREDYVRLDWTIYFSECLSENLYSARFSHGRNAWDLSEKPGKVVCVCGVGVVWWCVCGLCVVCVCGVCVWCVCGVCCVFVCDVVCGCVCVCVCGVVCVCVGVCVDVLCVCVVCV